MLARCRDVCRLPYFATLFYSENVLLVNVAACSYYTHSNYCRISRHVTEINVYVLNKLNIDIGSINR